MSENKIGAATGSPPVSKTRSWSIVWWGRHHWRTLGFEADHYGRVFCIGPLALYRKVWDTDGGASWRA